MTDSTTSTWTGTGRVDDRNVRAVLRDVQAIAPLPPEKLEELQLELAWVDQGNASEQTRRMRYLYVLADKYGVQPLDFDG